MADKRIEITQGLCRKVQLMMNGGAKAKEIRNLLGISTATISRIKAADFDAFKYQQNSEKRRVVKKALAPEGVPVLQVPGEEDAELEECAARLDAMASGAEKKLMTRRMGPMIEGQVPEVIEEELKTAGQVPGQVSMFEQEGNEDIKALVRGFMRLYAGKTEDSTKTLKEAVNTEGSGVEKLLLTLIEKENRKIEILTGIFNRMYDIGKVNDMLGQILRRLDNGKR